MSQVPPKNGPPLRLGQGAYLGTTANNQSLLLDKLHARTSTPDSEALASSDDEGDHRQEPVQAVAQPPKPVRRPSWLNETSQTLGRPRKESFASSSMSPTASHPSTPSAETGASPWGTHSASSAMGRASGGVALNWGAGIWNTERKDPPSRLSEVLPSPTSTMPPGAGTNSFFGGETQTSPVSRDGGANSQIPFAIPLHPTPKTYRSQSYSVGQLDPDVPAPPSMSSSGIIGRARHPALQHRPSRPSMLSEMANDGSMLGKVKEVEDDDDESASDSMQGSLHQISEAKQIERLTRENAMLRQQQQQQHHQHQHQQYNSRIRPRAVTGATYVGNGYSLRESVPEESDYAIDELDEANESGDPLSKRSMNRRLSEYSSATGPTLRNPFGVDNRKPDTALKKALWSSSLGFQASDVSQSRRHSFANMPTRQGSIGSLPDTPSGLEPSATDGQQGQDYPPGYPDVSSFGPGNSAASYLGAPSNLGTGGGAFQAGFNNQFSPSYGIPNPFANRAPSPHRAAYSIAPPRHNQLLHIVLFKCARADVFYIQEGTGLTVKPGDLVIVEADRGTDLGTVAKDNVDWQVAKELKEHYAEEQYKWLMMYSQGAAAAQEGTGAGLLAATGLQGSAIGGMGPQGQHHMQEPNAGELRPKLIKRLAQNHEVHALRDKEGQEAKAKRVCMQKVKEHGLNMEILDAEFQMDWKKLTFYYFADSYINFNSLVTDLFKIYKTRIWMSAINPASFASPTLGIQAPSGIGPGAVNAGRGSTANDRRQNQPPREPTPSSTFTTAVRDRGFRPNFGQPFGGERGLVQAQVPTQASGYPPSNYPYSQFSAFGNPRANVPYVPGGNPAAEGFPGGSLQQPTDFSSMRHRFANPQSGPSPAPHSQGASPIAPQNDWIGSFQGLSLNSH